MVLIQKAEQWNGIKDPEMTPYICHHLIDNKGTKNIHWRKQSLFNKWCCENWIFTLRRLKLDLSISHPVQKLIQNGSKILM
jgi:hypothetical protein